MPENNEDKSVPFFPDHLLYEAKVAMWFGFALVIIGIFALYNPLGLGEPADPMVTPEHTTPEWYFLWLYQILKMLDKPILGIEGPVIGAVLPVILVIILVIWPFLDTKPNQSRRQTRNRVILSTIMMVVIIILTFFGGR